MLKAGYKNKSPTSEVHLFLKSFIYKSVGGDGIAKGVVIHATAYDGTLERACLACSLPVLSFSDVLICHQYTVQSVSTFLLEEWKRGAGEVGKCLPKYNPNPPPEQQADDVALPRLAICSIDDNKLSLSAETRSLYAADPVRAPEWRKMLKAFDDKWQAEASGNEPRVLPNVQPNVQPNGCGPDQENMEEGEPAPPTSPSDWGDIFAGEPRTKEDVEGKYGAGCHTFAVTNQITGLVVDGPKLFFVATADTEVDVDQPVLCFGAGTWLLDAKASSFMEDRLVLLNGSSTMMFGQWFLSIGAPTKVTNWRNVAL